MPCFYCGKRVSLVRQMADADFCSDEHRKRYHALTRLALDRLLDHNQQRPTPVVRPEQQPDVAFVPSVPPPVRTGKAIECPPAATFVPVSPAEPVAGVGSLGGAALSQAPPAWEARTEACAPATGLRPLESADGIAETARAQAVPAVGAVVEPPPAAGFRKTERPGALAMPFAPHAVASGGRATMRPALRRLAAEKLGHTALPEARLMSAVRPAVNRGFASRPGAGFLDYRRVPEAGIQSPLRCAREAPAGGHAGDARSHSEEGAPPKAGRPYSLQLLPVALSPSRARGVEVCAIAVLPLILPRYAVASARTASLAQPHGAANSRSLAALAESGPRAANPPAPVRPAAARPVSAETQFGVTDTMLRYPALSRLAPGVLSSPEPGADGIADPMCEAGPMVRLPGPARRAAVAVSAANAAAGNTRSPAMLPAPELSPFPRRGALATCSMRESATPVPLAWAVQARAEDAPVMAVPATVPAMTERAVRRAALGQTSAMPLPGTPVRGIFAVRLASWQPSPAAAPELAGATVPPPAGVLGVAALRIRAAAPMKATVQVGPRRSESVFPLNEALLPPVAALVFRGELLPATSAALPPRPVACRPEVRPIDFAFTDRDPLLPDLTLVEEPAAACLTPVVPAVPGAAGPQPSVPAGPARLKSVPRAPESCSFPAHAAHQPESAGIGARRLLESAAAFPVAGQPATGAPRSETVEATAPPARNPEILNVGAIAAEFNLAKAAHAALAPGGFRHAAAPRAADWFEFGEEVPGFAQLRSLIPGVRWAGAELCGFAAEPERPPAGGDVRRAAAHAAPEFDLPAECHPELARRTIALGEAGSARLAAPALRDDARTVQRKFRLAPAFRLNSRPSRLPVFHATTEKAHMPAGVFRYIERDDRDDERTALLAPSAEAALPGPLCPDGLQPVPSRRILAEAPLVDSLGDGLPGAAFATGGHGERAFQSEPCFVEAGLPILGVDFDAIVESCEPRWRSALKTASGLFRGVLLFIPGVLVLSAMLTGCSSAGGGSLRDKVQNRASVRLEHNFSHGLDGWYGGREWARTWVREPASGFVRVGELALYRPAQPFTDYSFEFLGQIDGSSISWVYRAADLQNYYASTLLIERAGPVPAMALEHYQVIGGQESKRVREPVRMVLHNGRPYRIRQDVAGNGFTTSINGETAGFWTDDRLPSGTVGFLGAKGGAPHVYWMKVSYHDDFWGKLCATIAPK